MDFIQPLPWMTPQAIFFLAHVTCFGSALVGLAAMHFWVMRDLNEPLTNIKAACAQLIHKALWFALVGFWITGVFGIIAGANAKGVVLTGLDYVNNPKLLAKLTDVTILTANAVLMHFYVIPRMKEGFVFTEESFSFQLKATLIGAVSVTSWIWPVAMGFSKNWSKVIPYETFAQHYVLYLCGISVAALASLCLAHVKRRIGVKGNHTRVVDQSRLFMSPEQVLLTNDRHTDVQFSPRLGEWMRPAHQLYHNGE